MSDDRGRFSRRDLLTSGAALAATRLLGDRLAAQEDDARDAIPSEPRSTVVLVRHRDALTDDGRPDGAVLHHMLNQAVERLFDVSDARTGWQTALQGAKAVGVKTNVWRRLRTPPELEEAIRSEVVAAGVADENVAIDDRGVLRDRIFQRALGEPDGALINVRPMRTHHWSGLGTCLKNPIMFVPRPADYHGDSCATLGAFWRQLGLREKTKLNILVMLTPQFHGVGPHSFSEQFVWPYRGMIVGVDPVAVDATGARIIEARRREFFGEERPISPPPHHIRYAETRYELGVSDARRIDVVKMGWQDEALI
jgi:hypothetical protein